jgi:glyoxylase-like metal-dependent hydrolase (beta-lactamase superfamily II)
MEVGGIPIEAIATPGHTSESTCYLVGEHVLLTGDTLFTDAVGRPDLERGDAGAREGARALFRSLRTLLERFDDPRFHATHTAGSIGFDGEPIGASLAAARERIELLRAGELEFVDSVLRSLRAKPPNFESIIAVNEGRTRIDPEDALEIEAGPNCCAVG